MCTKDLTSADLQKAKLVVIAKADPATGVAINGNISTNFVGDVRHLHHNHHIPNSAGERHPVGLLTSMVSDRDSDDDAEDNDDDDDNDENSVLKVKFPFMEKYLQKQTRQSYRHQ